MKKITLLILILSSTGFSQSIERQVVGSSGTTLTDGVTASIDFTVGELVVSTITDGTTTLTQGFHQGVILLDIKINPIIVLQGALLNPVVGEETWMRDDLRVVGLIPTTSPYLDLITCNASVFTPTGSDAIVDWVWVELRDGTDNSIVIDSQSALLQRDGDVVGVDGISSLSFSQNADNYFVVVNHRNHLGIMSANPIAFSATSTVVDLSSSDTAILGGLNAVVDMTGIFALYGGDYDGNGQVLNTDLQSVIPLAGSSGYSPADADMNGQVLNTDIQNVIQPNTGKGEQF